MRGNAWTVAEVKELLHLRDIEKKIFEDIALLLGDGTRTESACTAKYAELKLIERRKLESAGVTLIEEPADHGRIRMPEKIVEQRQTLKYLEHKTITAFLLGDPLPGRSALDRKMQAACP
jgi:hypothetical protein